MLGIIVQLILSWVIIWLFERKDLSVLGLMPTTRRLLDFLLFFLLAACCCLMGFGLRMYFAGQSWRLNPSVSFALVLEGIWWNVKSVLFEELIFRGVLLYLIIRRWGIVVGITLSAIGFGIYHWFSFGIFGNIPQMIIIFLITGAMGVVYAFGYAKTWSLYIPSAIHLGWNLTTSVLFSETVIGNQVLVRIKPDPVVNLSYTAFYFMTFFPLLFVMGMNFWLLKRRKQLQLDVAKGKYLQIIGKFFGR